MKVEYIDHMGDDLMVANVARVSFDKWKQELDDKDVKLIHYLAKHEHTSPFRHTAISLRCEAPIFLARQLGKHQVGLAWNEVSRRYVDDEPEFFYPDEWRAKPDGSIKQGSGSDIVPIEQLDISSYTAANYVTPGDCMQICLEVYNGMLKAGVAPGMAGMILPQSMMTSWVWTGSLQAFFHVYRLRIDGHAQKEAQDFAKLIDEVVQPLFPNSWEALKNA